MRRHGVRGRLLVVLLVALAACGATAHPSTSQAWTTIETGMVNVSVESALYQHPQSDRFCIHVRVANPGKAAVAIDLRNYFAVFRPNQWGASATMHRLVIDERRSIVRPLDASATRDVIAVFATDAPKIAPGAVLDYYIAFNASSRGDVTAQATGMPFVILAMDGYLDVTDGIAAARLVPSEASREVAVPTPIAFRAMPAGARVIAD